MKQILLLTLLFPITFHIYSQKISGKSAPLTFKGKGIVAAERKQEEERLILEEQHRLAEIKKIEEVNKKDVELKRLTLQSLGITEDKIPKYFALIMGVSNYLHEGPLLPSLDQPAIDAGKLQRILTDQYTFAPENVTLLLNPNRKEVLRNLELLSEKLTEKDNLLIFYAGHGFYDKSKDFGYWLASDADVEDRSTWIRNSDLKDYLGAIRSKHTLLIADACFSGSIFKSRNVDAPSAIVKFNDAYRDKSRRAMTSGNLSTVPDKSVFIEFLLKRLDENSDVFLTTSLLFSRMYEPIFNNATRPLFGIIQGVGDEGGDFIFIRKN